ncbi:calcium-transporting ATPase [Aureococcus anophagefferens]|uniref:Calcium-transporting ATPase n=1 Tax=Aureococcus anophagefferens TaxID=44056 RepID=A0ABR1FL08_AURAN
MEVPTPRATRAVVALHDPHRRDADRRGGIPEGLPLTVTISLSTGCSDMVKENVLARKIAAAETPARSQPVICTDKTGTLTEGKMRCVKALFGGEDYVVSGRGFDPTAGPPASPRRRARRTSRVRRGRRRPGARERARRPRVGRALLLDDAEPRRGRERRDGLDAQGQLVRGADRRRRGQVRPLGRGPRALFPRATEIPFSSSRKMMAVVTAGGALDGAPRPPVWRRPRARAAKGAPNYVLESCAKTLRPDGSVGALDAATRAKIDATVDAAELRGAPVLAIACAPLRSLPYDDEADVEDKLSAILGGGLTFLGLVASIDPERQGVKAAIATANS